jgi:hypothetical protein
MARYTDDVNFVDHDFSNTVVTIDNDHVVQSLDSIEVEFDEDENTKTTVASGHGVFNHSQVRSGIIRLGILPASASIDYIEDKLEENGQISIGIKDSAAPKFDASTQKCKVMKHPVEVRRKEQEVVVWEFTAVYMKCRSGSYKIASV